MQSTTTFESRITMYSMGYEKNSTTLAAGFRTATTLPESSSMSPPEVTTIGVDALAFLFTPRTLRTFVDPRARACALSSRPSASREAYTHDQFDEYDEDIRGLPRQGQSGYCGHPRDRPRQEQR